MLFAIYVLSETHITYYFKIAKQKTLIYFEIAKQKYIFHIKIAKQKISEIEKVLPKDRTIRSTYQYSDLYVQIYPASLWKKHPPPRSALFRPDDKKGSSY